MWRAWLTLALNILVIEYGADSVLFGGAALAQNAGESEHAPPTETPVRDAKTDKLPSLDTRPPTISGNQPSATPKIAPTVVPAQVAVVVGQPQTANSGIQWTSDAALSVQRINPTGRNIEMTAPLKFDQFYLGDTIVRISAKDEISIPKDRLAQLITPLLRQEALQSFDALPATDGAILLSALSEKGFSLRFDSGQVALFLSLTVEQRAITNLSGSFSRAKVMSENVSHPANFAGYVNVRAGADYGYNSSTTGGIENLRLDFQGAIRWFNIVLENEATLDQDGFSRRGTRVVYDIPADALRITAGDIAPIRTGFQGGADILGVSAEKSYQKLQPNQNIRPTGSRSFRIERPSTVDVKVNGFIIQHLRLQPGDYNINDLQLSPGSNAISLVIEDDMGQVRTIDFTVFFDRSLLTPGMSEWALNAGVQTLYSFGGKSDIRNLYSNLEYDWTTPVISGFYERGLIDGLTGEIHFQAAQRAMMGGAEAFLQTAFGFWALEGAISSADDYGLDFAGSLHYGLTNIEGPDGSRGNFKFVAEYRGENFSTLDVGMPSNDLALNLLASYTQELPWGMAGSLSANYGLSRSEGGGHYGADITLSRDFGPSIHAGVMLGYAHGLNHNITNANDDLRAGVRFGYRVDDKNSIEANYDTHNNRSQVAYRHQDGGGIGGWNAQVELDHQGAGNDVGNETYGVNGSLEYAGNRGNVVVAHHAAGQGLNSNNIDQRTSVIAGTAIAFADGAFAVGRPISSGFAILAPHSNLPDSEISLGASQEAGSVSSGFFGPALASDIPAYSQSRLPIDVSNLPVGYDLGSSSFDLYAPYKGGYQLIVGSDYTVSAFGVMLDEKGEPITLSTGDAVEDGHPEGHHVQIFTNKAGKFGAQGIRPGKWLVDMATDPKTRFVIDVPPGTVGLLKLDTLRPAKS